MITNNWIVESGVFFQIPGNIVLHVTPGPGVFELVQPGAPTDLRIGLNKLYDKGFVDKLDFYDTRKQNIYFLTVKCEDIIEPMTLEDDEIDEAKEFLKHQGISKQKKE